MTGRRTDLTLVALFLLVISLPLAANLAGLDGGDPANEKRDLAPLPRLELSRQSIEAYGPALSAWFEDHFGFRSALVRWYGESRYFWLDVSPSASVLKGRDGWLLYAEDGAIEEATNEVPFSPAQLEGWRATLVGTHDWLRAQGIAYLFMVAPDKHVIYPEALPASVSRVHALSRHDQLDTMLRDATDVPTVDVRGALLAAKAGERLYARTDTHWNQRGAFVAYRQIIESLRRERPAIPPAWTRADFEAGERVIPGQDLAQMMGLMRVLSETDLILRPTRPRQARVVDPPGADASDELGWLVTEIPGSSLPRAVIFRDSFASQLAPFLSEHFSRAVYMWQNDFDADLVGREHPDVVIEEIAGRHLYVFVPSPELVPLVKAKGKR